MRDFRSLQLALRPSWGPHSHAQELAVVGEILDRHPEIGELVHRDVVGVARSDTGRPGLTGDQVLRIALLKQIHGLSYRELEFHLQDSAAFRSFVGLGLEDRPSFQALQANVKRIRPQTWEAIHRVLIGIARAEGIERGKTIRGDTTVVEGHIHEPTDSALLWDGVRVVTRLLVRMAELRPSLRKRFRDHTRRAKRRAYEIKFAGRRKDRSHGYRDLIRVAETVRDYALGVLELVDRAAPIELQTLASELRQTPH